VYKRQIYQIAESNRIEKIDSVAKSNRIESKLFLPELECSSRQLVLFAAPGPGRYIHYTLTGYKGHDASKFREPAYTIRPITFLNRCNVPWLSDTTAETYAGRVPRERREKDETDGRTERHHTVALRAPLKGRFWARIFGGWSLPSFLSPYSSLSASLPPPSP